MVSPPKPLCPPGGLLRCTPQELKAIESELSQAGPLSAVPSESQSQARHMIGLGGLGDAEGVLSRGGAGMSAPLVHRSASNSRMAAAASAVRRLDAAPDRAALDRGGARISEVPSYGEGQNCPLPFLGLPSCTTQNDRLGCIVCGQDIPAHTKGVLAVY